MSKEVDGQLSLFDSADDLLNELIKKPAKKAPAKKTLEKQELFKEGAKVKNIYTGTTFIVLADRGNELLVRGSDNSSHEMLKADIEPEETE